jgi:hypothetical protein
MDIPNDTVWRVLENIYTSRHISYPTFKVFQKEIYNGITNIAVWRVLRNRLHLKLYKLPIVQHLERRIVCTPL